VAEWYGERSESAGGETTEVQLNRENGVSTVHGIGSTYAQRLERAGIETVADLRKYDPETLAKIANASPSRAKQWRSQVKSDSSGR
jgi:polyhydroxyalkanoate synthase